MQSLAAHTNDPQRPASVRGLRAPALLSSTGWRAALIVFVAALLATALLGYHPDAEDGGIYAAAIQARLNPALFPHDHVWVTAHTRFALFVPATAALTRIAHLPLAAVLFAVQFLGILATLAAAAHLARTLTPGERLPWLAPLAVAIMAGLPVAGTALYAVDPYCTARTVTTPLLLFALSLALRERWTVCALCWAVAATMHPLMAIWGALPLLLAAALSLRHPRRWIFGLAFAILLAGVLLNALYPADSAAARAAALTRAYWFPPQWRWYEWVGAAAPPCLLALLYGTRSASRGSPTLPRLVNIACATTGIATALAVCCARQTGVALTVARLQPMRSLHLVFLAFLAGGAAMLQPRLKTPARRYGLLTACTLAAVSVLAMQRSLYPHTPHLERSSTSPRNPWTQAFLWCRDHTPTDALFALDAHYINRPAEDSQGFRSIALRSALPDEVKDAGIAAVLPPLAPAWQVGVQATAELDSVSDAQRRARLFPLGVTWLVLSASARTSLPCPFRNDAAKVCRLE